MTAVTDETKDDEPVGYCQKYVMSGTTLVLQILQEPLT
jgi:hypothetical protein